MRIVIIGGGVIGAGIAWHLVAAGCTDVVIVEARTPGLGSTSRATGGFRAQFSTEVNVRLSMLGREKLLRFKEEVGVDPGYRQSGYLFLASSAEEMAALERGRQVQRAAGFFGAQPIDVRDALSLNPILRADGLAGAMFCARDGYILPQAIHAGYLSAAVAMGARVLADSAVLAMRHDANGQIVEVNTERETLQCDHVINAAGAWAAEIARLAGVDLPVVPLKRQVAATVPTSVVSPSAPLTIFARDGFHFRERDGRLLLLRPETPASADPFDDAVEESWLASIRATADERVPALRDIAIDPSASWAGLYEMSPDKHAILGRSIEAENFWLANGSSGHGVMHAPAIGQILAEMLLGKTSSIDVRALRPSRFAEGQPNPVSDVL